MVSETLWNVVQRLGKSNSPVGVAERKVDIQYPPEPMPEEEETGEGGELKALIRKQWHISEHVTHSQIPPYSSAYKRTKTQRWSLVDTERFYQAVENFGSDLLMVRAYLPEFTDRQIYDKFKLEERKNPNRLEAAILKKSQISLEQFERKFGKIDEAQHYDPKKDPMLLAKKSNKQDVRLQLVKGTTREGVKQVEPPVAENIMELFM